MIWGGIIGNAIIGPFRVPKGLKLSSATYCPFLKKSLEPWLDNLPLATLKKIIFMHDNALSHAAKATTQFDINIFSNKKGGGGIYNKIASLSQKHFAYLGLSLANTQRNKNKNKKKAFGQTFGMEKRFVSIIYF